jgi:hypothetical protein
MSKNIVVLSDGTGQEGGKGHDTNIYKLFRMLEDRTEQQVVFYDGGLGTDWHKVTGNAFGAGLSKNLLQCYQFIYDNYNSGDRIYLFGFSRGAATVRSLSSFIHYFGILPKSRPELIKKAFNLYLKGQDKVGSRKSNKELQDALNEKATEFVHEHPNQWAQIEFLGVWDTVPALGLVALAGFNTFLGEVLRYNYHNYTLHPSVKNAYHAISIDDDRLWFHPSLWKEKTREEQIVEQVWFSGAHTDIGGGFDESGLSDISLEWMIAKAVSLGLRIYLGSRKNWNFVVAPDPTDLYHPPRVGFGKIFKEGRRNGVWERAEPEFGAPIIHQSVLWRHKRSNTINGAKDDRNPWILEKPNENSINVQGKKLDKNFKAFLRRKFYESVKFEWKKYDWEKDQPQTKKFDEWIKESKVKGYYESSEWGFQKVYMEDGYKEHCKSFWNDPENLKTRGDWLKDYSEQDWLKSYQPYQNWLKGTRDMNVEHKERHDPDWLEGYAPYQKWYAEHTETCDNKIYYFEPFNELTFEKADKRTVNELIIENVDKRNECSSPKEVKRGERGKDDLSLRDYDEDTLAVMQGKDRMVLEKRGINIKKEHDRIKYDLNRWTGNDEEYIKLFKLKGTE